MNHLRQHCATLARPSLAGGTFEGWLELEWSKLDCQRVTVSELVEVNQ